MNRSALCGALAVALGVALGVALSALGFALRAPERRCRGPERDVGGLCLWLSDETCAYAEIDAECARHNYSTALLTDAAQVAYLEVQPYEHWIPDASRALVELHSGACAAGSGHLVFGDGVCAPEPPTRQRFYVCSFP